MATAKNKKKTKVQKRPTQKKSVQKKAVQKKTAKTAVKKSIKKIVASKPSAKKSAPKKATPTKATSLKGAVRQDFSDLVSPLDDRILVSVEKETEKKTASGLILLESATASENVNGVVAAVGRGHLSKKGKIRPLDLKVGDQVLFPQFAGTKVVVAGKELVILRESEVLGILNG